MSDVTTISRALRKYVRQEVLDKSVDLLRKLRDVEEALTQRQTAELVYLACGASGSERTRAALKMDRPRTTEYTAVNVIEGLLLDPDGENDSPIPTSVLRDVSRQYRGIVAPGYHEGKRIEVRGGGRLGWTLHASKYVIE